jgi:hypothetical protein
MGDSGVNPYVMRLSCNRACDNKSRALSIVRVPFYLFNDIEQGIERGELAIRSMGLDTADATSAEISCEGNVVPFRARH